MPYNCYKTFHFIFHFIITLFSFRPSQICSFVLHFLTTNTTVMLNNNSTLPSLITSLKTTGFDHVKKTLSQYCDIFSTCPRIECYFHVCLIHVSAISPINATFLDHNLCFELCDCLA